MGTYHFDLAFQMKCNYIMVDVFSLNLFLPMGMKYVLLQWFFDFIF